MKNLKTYQQLFESAMDDLGYGLDDVRKLPMYKALLALGWEDISTDRGEKDLTLKLKHSKHGDYKYLTVQANGQVRTYYRGHAYPWITYKMRPKIKREYGDLYKNAADWNDSLLYLLNWTYKTMGMGLNLKGLKKKVGGWKSGSEYSIPDDVLVDIMEHMFREGDPEVFLSVYNNSDEDAREKIAKRLKLDADKINKIMNTKISVGAAMKFT